MTLTHITFPFFLSFFYFLVELEAWCFVGDAMFFWAHFPRLLDGLGLYHLLDVFLLTLTLSILS